MILPEIVSSQIYNGKQWKRLATVDTFRDLLCDLRWQWWKWRTTRAAWREMIKRYHPALYTGSTACTKHDYNSKCIHWKSHNMAHCSPQYFKPKQTCIQNMEDTVFSTLSLTVTVVHVLSVRPVDPYKSPLCPPIQGLRAAAHRLEPTLVQAAWPPTSTPEAAHLLNSFLHLIPAVQHHQPPPLSLHSHRTDTCI